MRATPDTSGWARILGRAALATLAMQTAAVADDQGAYGAVIRIERSAFGPDAFARLVVP